MSVPPFNGARGGGSGDGRPASGWAGGGPRIDGDWLRWAMDRMAEMVDPARPLYTRRSFTDVYRRAREWLAEQFEEAGLMVTMDAAANLSGRLEGTRPGAPAIVLGSHTDSVPAGGRFDGTLGVMAALAVARALRDGGVRLAHPLEIVDFLAEEPSDYGVSCVGSRAMAGALTQAMLDARNPAGETLAEGIRRMGGRPEHIAEGRPLRDPAELAAFMELHIEQGPVLDAEDVPVGVVTGIVGIRRSDVRFVGRADHAGTMPMDRRRDALVGAAEFIALTHELARRYAGAGGSGTWPGAGPAANGPERLPAPAGGGAGFVATVGQVHVHPNASNVVPGRADLVLEVRSLDVDDIRRFEAELLAAAGRAAEARGLRLEVEALTEAAPTPCAPLIVDTFREAVARRGYRVIELASGAGHDAAQMARLCPSGMLFVCCKDGASHHPDEWVAPEDMVAGAEVFLEAVLELDGRLAAAVRP